MYSHARFSYLCLVLFCISKYSYAFSATLDGVAVDSVDNYPEVHSNQISLGVGLFPVNAYYNGVSGDIRFTRLLSKTWSWEIVSLSYVFPFQTGITSELAEKYTVNPESIESLTYKVSSNLSYTLAYGKILLFDEYIRHFRTSIFTGPAFVATSAQTSYGAEFGIKFETFVRPSFAWFFSASDLIRIKKPVRNDLQYSIGSCIGF